MNFGKLIKRVLRTALECIPRQQRFRLIRSMVRCELEPDPELVFEVAQTLEDLEACYALLHDAYVRSGFMVPHPSGLRVTAYHALPTTTTLSAKYKGQVVGTLSIIRDGVFGFPMQSAFDLREVRAQGGRIAEISALAIHPSFRKSGGKVLFPLMKFMYEYCVRFFDVRHLVIAVNPERIALYEALLFFQRLDQAKVENYDFANGAPAVGATLDLEMAPVHFRRCYGHRNGMGNLHRYFVQHPLPNIRYPLRQTYRQNDPVMTPALLHYLFNQRTNAFLCMDDRQVALLHSIYDDSTFEGVLPAITGAPHTTDEIRRHRRHPLKSHGFFVPTNGKDRRTHHVTVLEVSYSGLLGRSFCALPEVEEGRLRVEFGLGLMSWVSVRIVRRQQVSSGWMCGFRILKPDAMWARCCAWLDAESDGLTDFEDGRHGPMLSNRFMGPHQRLNMVV